MKNVVADTYTLQQGNIPLLISMPHDGHELPGQVAERMTPLARSRGHADSQLAQLYRFATDMGASVLSARYCRYLVDLNCAPAEEDDDADWDWPQMAGPCPITTPRGDPVYLEEALRPDASEISERVDRYWRPYHSALRDELTRMLDRHGQVMLWDAHTLGQVAPAVSESASGQWHLATCDGASCDIAMHNAALSLAGRAPYTIVMNGRDKGGYITRHYGRPEQGVHALQVELARGTYMDEREPFSLQTERVRTLMPWLRTLVRSVLRALPVGRPYA